MNKKTLCVDGNYLLKQSFHGNKYTYDEDFGYIGAVATFFTIVRKMIREQQITKVIVFWDGVNSGRLRYEIYPYYKSNRDKTWNEPELILSQADINKMKHFQNEEETSLLLQKIRIQAYCEELFFRQIECPDGVTESDDMIAYYCLNYKEEDEEVIIYTSDQDLLMLIDIDKVSVYLGNKKVLVNKFNFNILYYNYHYKNTALIKAIEGCTSDVIYGASSVKEKTLLKHFPELNQMPCTIDFILTKAKEINEGRKKPLLALQNIIDGKTAVNMENVLNGQHLFELNYKLVNLLEPMITDNCIEHVEMQSLAPLSIEGRGGKNLLRLMYEDGFIKTIPGGPDGYKNFLIEFLNVVNSEKNYYKEYMEEN